MAGREKQRVLVNKEITINGNIKASCFDLNEEGMYIQTEAKFVHNNVINLEFDIDDRQIKVKASVRHIDPGFGFGVKFLNLSLQDKSTIKHFLHIGEELALEVKTVLLVDRNERSRSVYRSSLQQGGIKVIEADNGNDAFRLLQQTKPDVVIIDNHIEGINAYKILQFMQTRDDYKNVPVIMLTTKILPKETNRVLSLGVREYLVKATTTPKSLSEKVKGLIGD